MSTNIELSSGQVWVKADGTELHITSNAAYDVDWWSYSIVCNWDEYEYADTGEYIRDIILCNNYTLKSATSQETTYDNDNCQSSNQIGDSLTTKFDNCGD